MYLQTQCMHMRVRYDCKYGVHMCTRMRVCARMCACVVCSWHVQETANFVPLFLVWIDTKSESITA